MWFDVFYSDMDLWFLFVFYYVGVNDFEDCNCVCFVCDCYYVGLCYFNFVLCEGKFNFLLFSLLVFSLCLNVSLVLFND